MINTTNGWIPIDDHLPEEDGEYLCAMMTQPNQKPMVKVCHFNTTTQRFDMYPLKVVGWHVIDPVIFPNRG
jgi:hypothetical protein